MKQRNLIIGIALTILLLGGIGLGVYLTQQQQDVRQRAEEPTPTGPACLANEGSCEWDATTGATSYHYTIKEDGVVIDEGDVTAPTTKVTFTTTPNKTYECSVYAVNSCGQGEVGVGMASCVVSPTPSPTPTATPSATPTPTTPPSPTPTVVTPTPTIVIPTPTPTTIVVIPTPTPTVPVPTNTPLPTNPPAPTATPTQVVVGPTSTPTPTMAAPGSMLQTVTIAGGILLTVIGAIVLFIL